MSPGQPTPGHIPPGTIALFDIEAGAARKLDLGRSLIRADWIDDGKTLLALDVNTRAYVAISVDGMLVRVVAKLPPATAAPGEESLPSIQLVPVRDGRRVAVFDWKSLAVDLIDVFSGASERIAENTFGAFSPDGEYLAGAIAGTDASGSVDPSTSVSGVFSDRGTCGDARPFACIEWQFPQDERVSSREPWSPDGRHLLLARRAKCPDQAPVPGASPGPCTTDTRYTHEVYNWPERSLVLTLPPVELGEVRWAGNGELFVRGARDPDLGVSAYLVSLDGKRSPLPDGLTGCCASFFADRGYAIDSVTPGEDCSLIDLASGSAIAGVPRGAADTNDTGICQYVSWTPDGRWALATGVSTP